MKISFSKQSARPEASIPNDLIKDHDRCVIIIISIIYTQSNQSITYPSSIPSKNHKSIKNIMNMSIEGRFYSFY